MNETITLETYAGEHISDACERAVKLATEKSTAVSFTFNDTEVLVAPGESPRVVAARWSKTMEAAREKWLASDEYREREVKRKTEEELKRSAVMRESASTEAELREAASPWPQTPKQLSEYIESLIDKNHDYGTCVYAMSLAAIAAFNFVTHTLGVTGFQASCADMDFMKRSRHIKGPFMIIKGEDAMFPQYDLQGKLSEAMKEWKPWFKEEAKKKLQAGGTVHPDVMAHWEKLAK